MKTAQYVTGLKTAKALDLTIPPSMLVRATEIINSRGRRLTRSDRADQPAA
jgi:hypothetical protein